ncbi:hypothetical protein IID22_02290 [Patescibacteria group bacterium]|nr:hypothetical protein [Patescibacteria group bacterium]
MEPFAQYGIVCLICALVIKEVFSYLKSRDKKDVNGNGNRERRDADKEFKTGIVKRLEVQTLLLQKILDTGESTNGKAGRIEKDVTIIKIQTERVG